MSPQVSEGRFPPVQIAAIQCGYSQAPCASSEGLPTVSPAVAEEREVEADQRRRIPAGLRRNRCTATGQYEQQRQCHDKPGDQQEVVAHGGDTAYRMCEGKVLSVHGRVCWLSPRRRIDAFAATDDQVRQLGHNTRLRNCGTLVRCPSCRAASGLYPQNWICGNRPTRIGSPGNLAS